MPPRSNIPIRICGSKTTTGCKTCKQRHVKCDEIKPICLKCQKRNRDCVWDRSRSSSTQPAAPPIEQLSCYGTHDAVEVSAVKTFVTFLGKELSGAFANPTWCEIFPRVAQHEPAVWFALVACSKLDTDIRLGCDDHSIATRHYAKALQSLNVRVDSDGTELCKDVVLLCCILFAVFECLQSRIEPALRHICGGMKLLMEWNRQARISKDNRQAAYFDRTSLLPLFLTLDSQAVQLGASDFRDYCSLPAILDQRETSSSFETVEEANVSLSSIFNRLSRWGSWVEPCTTQGIRPSEAWMTTEQRVLQSQLAWWDDAFQHVLATSHPCRATLLLIVQRKVIQVFFGKLVAGQSEIQWDQFLPQFEGAILHAEEYMELTRHERIASESKDQQRPVFTVAMDIVMPLFFISTKCRHPALRRRALLMLKTCGRKEGIWDSALSAQVAERIIELEEAYISSDNHVPESARIYRTDVCLNEDTGAEITHKRYSTHDSAARDLEIREESRGW